ncbi:bifunctional siderophore receptor/adhesin Iha [soil metagenome]
MSIAVFCLPARTPAYLFASCLYTLAASASATANATANDNAQTSVPTNANGPVQSVEVRAANSASDERQRAIASKSIVTREEIIRYADSNLSDILKRLPGVTISNSAGRGNEVQMRGLGNGYTQILLNGEPAPNGFSIDSIAPELIERIEVMRSASAEFSNQAIAGSINIVLKKINREAQQELTFTLQDKHGQLSPGLGLQLSDRRGQLSYALAAKLQHQQHLSSLTLDESASDPFGKVQLQRHTEQQALVRKDELSLAPRLVWSLADSDSLSWQSFISSGHMHELKQRQETSVLNTPSEFPVNQSTWDAYTNALRSDVTWLHQLADSARVDLKLGLQLSRHHTTFDFIGTAPDPALSGRNQVSSEVGDQTLSLNGKYSAPFMDRHSLVVGWDGSLIGRNEDRIEHMTGAQAQPLANSNENYQAKVKRLALFAQDEWDISQRWSAALGLRWEGLQTTTSGNVLAMVDNRSSVFSPMLQSVWKLAAEGNSPSQLRLALTRTYKAPSTTNLIPRRYTVDNNNSPTNPDSQGNPQLRPELAWGMDAAFERNFAGGGLFSASVYLRKIDDVILEQISEHAGVWTSSPGNSGRAQIHGIEAELKLPLQRLAADAPDIELRANINRNWSRVEQVPGPDNRLDQQVPFSANLAFDYKASAQLSLGANVSIKQGGKVRSPASLLTELRSENNTLHQLDCYALWRVAKPTQIRLAITNLLTQDQRSIDLYQASQGSRQLTTTTPGIRSIRLVLEHQFQ